MRPPTPSRAKKSAVKVHKSSKINLTRALQIKVQIIDWKRCSIRSLLLIAYIAVIHLIAYPYIIVDCYQVIFESDYLKYAYMGFCANLLFCLIGICAAVKAMSFAWNSLKFTIGIITIILSMFANLALFKLGSTTTPVYEGGILREKLDLCAQHARNETPDEALVAKQELKWGSFDIDVACIEVKIVSWGIFLLPLILPPTGILSVFFSIFAAIKAVCLIPRNSKADGVSKNDADWLAPYETYDFYVGRNVPKIPGYDEHYEGSKPRVDKLVLEDSDSDSDENEKSKRGHHHRKVASGWK